MRRQQAGKALALGIDHMPRAAAGTALVYLDRLSRRIVARLSDGTVRQLDAPAGSGGGVTDHTALTSLAWASSDHTGTAGRLAGFDGAGAAENTAIGSGLVHSAGSLAVDFGTGAGEVCEGNDARLSDDRDPTAHASSHLSAGSDPVLAEVRTAGLGLQLDARGLLDLSAVAASAAWHPASCMATGATLSQVGMAASAAMGSGSAAGHAIRMTGTAGTGRRLDTRTMTRDGGFVMAIRFRFPSTIGARRVWIGLHGTSPTDSDTAAGEFVGWLYSQPRGDAGPRPVSNDGTQTDGTAMTAFVADHWYLAVMYQYSGGSTVYLEMHDLTAGTVDTDTITADLPSTATPLAWIVGSFNQGVNKSTDFSHCLIYVDQA